MVRGGLVPFSSIGNSPRATALVGVLLSSLILIATFRVGIEKNLVGTFSDNEWGRYLFGMGAALTHMKGGPRGYIVDIAIETRLAEGGLTAVPSILEGLGTKFPDNLRNPELMQRALEGARDYDVPPLAQGEHTRLRGSHGDDVGLATFSRMAFLVFGVKVSS